LEVGCVVGWAAALCKAEPAALASAEASPLPFSYPAAGASSEPAPLELEMTLERELEEAPVATGGGWEEGRLRSAHVAVAS
jgi:hypothetical protein